MVFLPVFLSVPGQKRESFVQAMHDWLLTSFWGSEYVRKFVEMKVQKEVSLHLVQKYKKKHLDRK